MVDLKWSIPEHDLYSKMTPVRDSDQFLDYNRIMDRCLLYRNLHLSGKSLHIASTLRDEWSIRSIEFDQRSVKICVSYTMPLVPNRVDSS